MVRANTVVGPGCDSAVIRIKDRKKAIAMQTNCNGKYVYLYEGNQLREEIKYRGENEKENHNTYGYDEHGKLIDIVKYDINNTKDRLIKYVYESY